MYNILTQFADVRTCPISSPINPLYSSFIFEFGKVIVVMAAIAFIGSMIAMIVYRTNNWPFNRYITTAAYVLPYTLILWVGASMFFSYMGHTIVDVVNGAIILGVTIYSFIKHWSIPTKANRILLGGYIFIIVLVAWTLLFPHVVNLLDGLFPYSDIEQYLEYIHPQFFLNSVDPNPTVC